MQRDTELFESIIEATTVPDKGSKAGLYALATNGNQITLVTHNTSMGKTNLNEKDVEKIKAMVRPKT